MHKVPMYCPHESTCRLGKKFREDGQKLQDSPLWYGKENDPVMPYTCAYEDHSINKTGEFCSHMMMLNGRSIADYRLRQILKSVSKE